MEKKLSPAAALVLGLVNQKLAEIEGIVNPHFLKYEKKTQGQQSIGPASLEFACNCANKFIEHPDVVSGTYEGAVFLDVIDSVHLASEIEKAIKNTMGTWQPKLKICKADAMNHANTFYGNLKVEALKKIKYQPAYQELMVFYKRSKTEDQTETDAETRTVMAKPKPKKAKKRKTPIA